MSLIKTRRISLYWASISISAVFESTIFLILSAWKSNAYLRKKVIKQVSRIYKKDNIYLFSSGRASLACFLKTFLVDGDEVIISAYTCLAVPTAIIASKKVPVYVDIDLNSLSIDTSRLWESITPRTRAIVLQHTLGNIAPIHEIREKAHHLGLLIIEDCALSIGTRDDGNLLGTFGDAAIFSMELSKTVSCGWGGILLINNPTLAVRMNEAYKNTPELSLQESLRDFLQTTLSAICADPVWPHFLGRLIMAVCWRSGLFRMSTPIGELEGVVKNNFISKMGRAQLVLAELQWRRFETITQKCSENYIFLSNAIRNMGYKVHAPADKRFTPVANRVSFISEDRERMIKYFLDKKIELGVWFDGPLSPLPSNKIFNFSKRLHPNAVSVAKKVVNIPCHSRLTTQDNEYIITCLAEYSRVSSM